MALCMRPVVTYVSTRYNVKRIACMRCGLQKALEKEQGVAGSSNKASGDNDIISSTLCKTTTTDGYAEQDRDLVGTVPSCVDVVVINDITELHQQGSDLIASAERRLCPDGILMIALPVRNTLETAVISAASWLARRNEGHPSSLSLEQLSDSLQAHGFTILESIKVGGHLGESQALVLVARKTNHTSSTCPSPPHV